MKPVLRRLHSPDVVDLAAYMPESRDHFGILVQAMIGPAGGQGEESFDFVYCSPSWLEQEIRGTGPVWTRHYLVDSEFDHQRLHTAVERICHEIDRSSWTEVAQVVGRYGHWEFEDYQPHSNA